jgi:hypothetical protein
MEKAAAMTPDVRIAELEEKNRRLEAVLRAIMARAENWGRLETTEYYRHGLRTAYLDVAMTCLAGLNYAAGVSEEP